MEGMEKRSLIETAVKRLEEEVASLRRGIDVEKKAMQDAPGAMMSRSDTTRSQKEFLIGALQKNYAQAYKTLASLKQLKLGNTNIIQGGALVEIEEGEERLLYLIVPTSSMRIKIDDRYVQLISGASPIARGLYGHRAGDIVKVEVPNGLRSFKILSIQ